MRPRRTIIGVIGSGDRAYPELSHPLGEWIARREFHLLNGGGGGVMQAVAEAFQQSEAPAGQVIGVLPANTACEHPKERVRHRPPDGYPNPFVDISIVTHLPLSGSRGRETASRNHIVVLSADFIVALPGSLGTASEIQLALEYGKPHVLLNADRVWESFRGKGAALVENLDAVFEAIERWRRGPESPLQDAL